MTEIQDKFVINGPEPVDPLPVRLHVGQLIYQKLMLNTDYHEAMVDMMTKRTMSYKELFQKTCALADALVKMGYWKHSVVSVCSENSLEFFIPVISALYVGCVVAPVNHNYTDLELKHCLNISKPQVMFCSKETYKKIMNLQLPYIEKIIVIDCYDDKELTGCAQSMQSLIPTYQTYNTFYVTDFSNVEHPAFILSSSGTTGLPKGVVLSHMNIIVRYMHTLDPRYTTTCEDDCFLGVLPFYHAYGLITNLLMIALNQKIVVLKKFQEECFLQAIQEYKIPNLWLVPPLIVLLAKSPNVAKYDLSCVKEITCGAAPLSKDTEEAVKRRLNVKVIRQAYGLSEATLAVICMGSDEERFGSSGKVVSYMSCKVRDPETGLSLGPKEVGEICVKGPMIMLGYHGNEQATKDTFTDDGWLLSGDLGYYDEDGYFFIVDRLKELIKYKGFQVAPAELEAVLLTHPKIKDAGVVGRPDEEAGELPMAFVAKKNKAELTEEEVKKFIADQVSHPKWLRGGVIFVPDIPKTPSGKILRRELRDLLKTHMSTKAKL